MRCISYRLNSFARVLSRSPLPIVKCCPAAKPVNISDLPPSKLWSTAGVVILVQYSAEHRCCLAQVPYVIGPLFEVAQTASSICHPDVGVQAGRDFVKSYHVHCMVSFSGEEKLRIKRSCSLYFIKQKRAVSQEQLHRNLKSSFALDISPPSF